MTNQIEAFIHFNSFSACCLILTSFSLIACLPNTRAPMSFQLHYRLHMRAFAFHFRLKIVRWLNGHRKG